MALPSQRTGVAGAGWVGKMAEKMWEMCGFTMFFSGLLFNDFNDSGDEG